MHKALGKGVAHATELTFAGLASWVGFLMAPQLSGQGVGLAALLAGESALPRVQEHVMQQEARAGQVTPTHGTLAPLGPAGPVPVANGSPCACGEEAALPCHTAGRTRGAGHCDGPGAPASLTWDSKPWYTGCTGMATQPHGPTCGP